MRKIALITGGAKGIGKSICLEFAKNNYDIIFTYNNSSSLALDTKLEIESLGVNCDIYKIDFSELDKISLFSSEILSSNKKIDILVNNAGISSEKVLIDENDDDISTLININLTSVVLLTKYIMRNMLQYKEGNIINISSIWGMVGSSMESVYSASKAGIIGFTKALAKEYAPSNIRVNAIAPGAINTDMLKLKGQEKKEFENEIPLGYIGEPQEIAKTALFIANSNYLTGQVISPNGGLVI